MFWMSAMGPIQLIESTQNPFPPQADDPGAEEYFP